MRVLREPDMDDFNPDYADYDDYDPRNDPVVQLELLTHGILQNVEMLERFAVQDRMTVYGSLPDIHEIWTRLGLILSQYPNILPAQAAE